MSIQQGTPQIQKIVVSKVQCENMLQCVFSLNPLGVEAYKILTRDGSLRADELAEKIGKDRSTAYRCLRHLISCGICYKETQNIESGGYFHMYSAVPPEEVKSKLRQCVEDWYQKMDEAIEEFTEEIKPVRH